MEFSDITYQDKNKQLNKTKVLIIEKLVFYRLLIIYLQISVKRIQKKDKEPRIREKVTYFCYKIYFNNILYNFFFLGFLISSFKHVKSLQNILIYFKNTLRKRNITNSTRRSSCNYYLNQLGDAIEVKASSEGLIEGEAGRMCLRRNYTRSSKCTLRGEREWQNRFARTNMASTTGEGQRGEGDQHIQEGANIERTSSSIRFQ